MLNKKILTCIGKNLDYIDLTSFGIISKKSLFLLVPHIIKYSIFNRTNIFFLKNKYGNVFKSEVLDYYGVSEREIFINIQTLLLTYSQVDIVEYSHTRHGNTEVNTYSFARNTIMNATVKNLLIQDKIMNATVNTNDINICINYTKFISNEYLKSLKNNNCIKFKLIIKKNKMIEKLIEVYSNIDKKKYIIEELIIMCTIPDDKLRLLNILSNLKKIRFTVIINETKLSLLNKKIRELELVGGQEYELNCDIILNKFKYLEILEIDRLEDNNLDISKLNFLKYLTICLMKNADIIFNSDIVYKKN
jgi:hypothetical protein